MMVCDRSHVQRKGTAKAASSRRTPKRLSNRCLSSCLSALLCCIVAAVLASARAAERNVTFLSTSDSHYDAFENEDRNARDRDSIREMNLIATRTWPEKLGGGDIERPRGVVVLGDCIDDGDRLFNGQPQSRPQYEFFRADFGLDGTDGLLKYPVFEGWGNHDGPPSGKERFGFSFQAELQKRNALRLQKGLIGQVSENGLHYSWELALSVGFAWRSRHPRAPAAGQDAPRIQAAAECCRLRVPESPSR
jgi:hypothetical protein